MRRSQRRVDGVNDTYLYRHAMRAGRPLRARIRWWIRFRLPQFAADLTKVTVVMCLVAGFLSFFDRI